MSTSEEILAKWEIGIGVCSMAQDRVACGGWPEPSPWTPEDYLAWIEDEAKTQEKQCMDSAEESQKEYTKLLRQAARELRDVGVTPIPLPWEAIHFDSEAEGLAFIKALRSG